MDCCSSNYMDYRHSINNNFCYPYSPGMMRSASPYQLPPGAAGRYGADYRGGYYDGSFDKYYGGSYHPAAGSGHGYVGNYYGNSYSTYREFAYNEYYNHPSSPAPSPHPFAGPPPGSFHGPHMFNRHQSLPLPFQRESYYHQRDPHQYAAGFSNYSGNPYKGADSNPGSCSTPSSSSTNNASSGGSGGGGGGSPGESPLFGAQQNEYTHSPDYSAQSYNSGSSPNHPHHHRHHLHPHLSPGEGGGSSGNSSYPPSEMPNATVCRDPNAEYRLCGDECPRTCENLHPKEPCSPVCRPGCYCKKGYVWDNRSGRCILPCDCPAPEPKPQPECPHKPKPCDCHKEPKPCDCHKEVKPCGCPKEPKPCDCHKEVKPCGCPKEPKPCCCPKEPTPCDCQKKPAPCDCHKKPTPCDCPKEPVPCCCPKEPSEGLQHVFLYAQSRYG